MTYPATRVWDVDDVAVDLAVEGHHQRLNPGERLAAIRRLNARGWSDPTIARHIRCRRETVQRVRARHGIPAARLDA